MAKVERVVEKEADATCLCGFVGGTLNSQRLAWFCFDESLWEYILYFNLERNFSLRRIFMEACFAIWRR